MAPLFAFMLGLVSGILLICAVVSLYLLLRQMEKMGGWMDKLEE